MGVRGKKSAASIEMAALVAPTELQKLPDPPAYLTPEQEDVWRLVISSRGGDMVVPESFPILVEYCRCVVAANQIAAQLDSFDPSWAGEDEGLKRWDRLLAMQDREAKRMAMLGAKLRLTPSARYHPDKAGTIEKRGARRKPWEMSLADGE